MYVIVFKKPSFESITCHEAFASSLIILNALQLHETGGLVWSVNGIREVRQVQF